MSDAETPNADAITPRECIVANVSAWYWEAAREGKPHFRAGAKVYVIGDFIGWDYLSSVGVLGQHIKSHRWVELIMRTHFLENARVTHEYSPSMIERLERSDALARHNFDSTLVCERMRQHTQAWQDHKTEAFDSAVQSEPGTFRLISRIYSQGGLRFGADPPEYVKSRLFAIHTVGEIQTVFSQVESVGSWEELFSEE